MYLGSEVADQSKVSLFNNYFYSVFNGNTNSELSESIVEDNSDTVLSDMPITPTDVHETLFSLDPLMELVPRC